jgi:RHS repeat-associated protein
MRSRWSRPYISEPPRYTQGKAKPMQAAQAAKKKMSMPVFSLAASAAATTKSAGTNPIPIPDAWLRQHAFFKTNPISQLGQNSRLGHQLPTAVLYQGLGPAISNTATGFGDPLYDFHVRPRCTSKERDAETGLDFFQARYMSSAQGRFSSPDPLGNFVAAPTNPQSWNLYSYALNSPLVNIDPTGTTCVTTQVQNADGTTTNSVADNGDSKGCADAQVAPTPKDQAVSASDVTPQQANVNAQQGSLWAFLTAPSIPRYVPNDTPLDQKGQTVVQELSKRSTPIPPFAEVECISMPEKRFQLARLMDSLAR